MAKGCFKGIAIKGIACAVPNNIRPSNYWHTVFGQESVDRFIKMTGVERVCQCIEGQTASDLAYVAAKALLKHKNMDSKSIGALVFISQGPDYRMPATACVLQYRLGLPEDCICFDEYLQY